MDILKEEWIFLFLFKLLTIYVGDFDVSPNTFNYIL